jgi:hypothetical protein
VTRTTPFTGWELPAGPRRLVLKNPETHASCTFDLTILAARHLDVVVSLADCALVPP